MLLCLRHSRPPAAAFVAFGLALIYQAKRDESVTICTSGKRSEERQVFPNVRGWLVCCACVRVRLAGSFMLPLPSWFPSTLFFQIRLCIQTDGSRLLAFLPPPLLPPFNSLPLLTQTANPPPTSLTHTHTSPFYPSPPPSPARPPTVPL